MKQDLIRSEILPYLKKNLTKERLGHTMAVAYFAAKLARKHGLDSSRARLAGLLHDAVKCWKKKDLVRYARRHDLEIPDFEITCKKFPKALHAYVGARVVEREFGIKDRAVLSAVAKHTFGSRKMSSFEKCVYLADLASPDRKFPEAAALRNLAMKDLDRAFVAGAGIKIKYTLKDEHPLHPESIRVWNHWVQKT